VDHLALAPSEVLYDVAGILFVDVNGQLLVGFEDAVVTS
jgi:hypothetical protein